MSILESNLDIVFLKKYNIIFKGRNPLFETSKLSLHDFILLHANRR